VSFAPAARGWTVRGPIASACAAGCAGVRHEARPGQTLRQQFGQPHRIVDVGLAARQEAIAEELDANAPDGIEEVEPFEGDEDDDPLYDSTRDYVEQVDRFKQHQGKSTTRTTPMRPAPDDAEADE
jgi:hypothetical protein